MKVQLLYQKKSDDADLMKYIITTAFLHNKLEIVIPLRRRLMDKLGLNCLCLKGPCVMLHVLWIKLGLYQKCQWTII
jgi:hypothetical protein